MPELLKSVEKKIKFFIRKVENPFQLHHLYMTLKREALFLNLKINFPAFGNKAFRPYLSSRFTPDFRLKIILDNYRIADLLNLMPLYMRSNCRSTPIFNFYGKSGEIFSIEFEANIEEEQEGEAFLKLMHKGICVKKIGFSMFYENEQKCIYVALVQGAGSLLSKEITKNATKLLYGSRPIDFLIIVFLSLGEKLGFTKLIGVGNGNRIGLSGQRNQNKVIKLCYDSFWMRLGGQLNYLGDYELSCSRSYNHDPVTTKSNKRSEKRKRDLLRAEVSQKLFDLILQTKIGRNIR